MALREIGSAFVRLFVKKDGLSADLKSAESEVKQTAQKMEAHGTRTAGGVFASIKGLNKAFTATIGATLKLISHITLIGTAIGAVVGLAIKLSGAFGDAEQKAKSLRAEVEKTGKELAGGEKEPLASLLKAIGEADDAVLLLRQRIAEKPAPNDIGFGGTSIQELTSQLNYAIRTRERAIDTLRNYQRRINDEQEKKDSESAKKKAEEFAKAADLAAQTTVEAAKENEYDPENDPLLKGIDAFKQHHADALEYVIDMLHKRSAEATREWGEEIIRQQERAHSARIDQIEQEARAQEDAQRRLEGLMSSQRNQSANGDIKTMIGLLKVLVDK